jgi:hypothetical protein
MTRFQVRKNLRKASCKAKTIAVEALHVTVANVAQGQSRLGIRKAGLKLATVTILGVASQVAGSAQATTLTLTSPSGGTLPSGVSPVGGVVLDLIGQNDARVTSQLAAKDTFVGFYNGGTPSAYQGNPGTIGIQNGFTSSVLQALGGGLKKVGIRFTLYDGDTAAGDFDSNDNTLLVNGFNFGNWSDVNTETTDGLGNAAPGSSLSGGGFRDNTLDTGWFSSSDTTLLSNFFTSLVNTQEVVYQVNDIDPYDNYYDFTQGINSSLVNVGSGPVVQPPNPGQPVPEPITILGTLAAGGIGAAMRRRSKLREKETAQV